jgi:P27 family predicted phage terminase small subunit
LIFLDSQFNMGVGVLPKEKTQMRGMKPAVKPMGDLLVLPAGGVKSPPAPKTLPEGIAQECWEEVTREMLMRNTYDSDCRDMVEAYCVQRARFIEANARIEEMGLILKSKRGMGKRNPYVTISNHAYDRMVRLGAELGLTPVRRERVARSNTALGRVGAEKFLKSHA